MPQGPSNAGLRLYKQGCDPTLKLAVNAASAKGPSGAGLGLQAGLLTRSRPLAAAKSLLWLIVAELQLVCVQVHQQVLLTKAEAARLQGGLSRAGLGLQAGLLART